MENRNLGSLADASDRAEITIIGGTLRPNRNGNSDFAHDLAVAGNAALYIRRTNASGGSNFTHRFGDLPINNNTLSISSDTACKYRAVVASITLSGKANFNVGTNTGFLVEGTVNGSFGFTKSGPGTMTLAGPSANSYTGTTTVSAGTLLLSKTARTNAIAGHLSITGDLSLPSLASWLPNKSPTVRQ